MPLALGLLLKVVGNVLAGLAVAADVEVAEQGEQGHDVGRVEDSGVLGVGLATADHDAHTLCDTVQRRDRQR